MAPKKVVQKPQPKAVKARRIINVGTEGEAGASSGLPLHAAQIAKKRQLKKALGDLYAKLAEKSTMDISQARQVHEAMEKILTSDLKEYGVFKLPGIASFFRKQLPARGDMGEKKCVWSARQSSCQRHRVQGQGRVFDATKKLHGLSSRS